MLGKWNAVFNFFNVLYPYLPQKSFNQVFLCFNYPEYHGLWVYSCFRRTQFCENQLWKLILGEGLYTSHVCLTEQSCCYLCAWIVPGGDSWKELSVLSGIFSILSAPVSMKLVWGRSRQISHAPCIHHCPHKGPQNVLAFNFNLNFFNICFLWLLEISCQPWVSKLCCTRMPSGGFL